MFKNFAIACLVALSASLGYLHYQQAHELRWAEWNLFQEEATSFQLMMNGFCRMDDPGTMKEFCDASKAGRREYLKWYSKQMNQPIPDFPA